MSGVLKDKVFIGNVGKLFGSSFIAQLIPFGVLPVLTRIYSPEDFGFWAYFLSISGIFSILMTGNYEFAIVLPKDDDEALNVTAGALLITVMFFIAGLIIFPFFTGITFALWICVMGLSMALFRISSYWNNRCNRFGKIGTGNISRSFSASAVQLFNGFYFFKNYSGLASGSVIGYMTGTAVQSAGLAGKFASAKGAVSRKRILSSASRYKKFPKYFMPAEFLNFVSTSVPVLFLTNLFDAAVTGLYSVPHKFINTPLTMLGSSISQAYFKKTNDLKNAGHDLGYTTADIYKKLLMLGIVPLSIIAGYGDIIFGFLLGPQWKMSGVYAALLAPWMLMVFVASPISIVFATLEKQEISLKLNALLLSVRVLSFVIGGIVFRNALLAVFLFGASGFVYWLYFSFYVIKVSGGSRKDIVLFSVSRLIFIMLPVILSRSLLNV